MTDRCGIDTSILVRLTIGQPEADFTKTAAVLTHMVEREHRQLFASNLVIGEAYVALQHHCSVSKLAAKSALRSVLTSGLVSPLGGQDVLDALAATRGCGLFDRLIALQYGADEMTTLTLDRKMASLPNVTRLAAVV